MSDIEPVLTTDPAVLDTIPLERLEAEIAGFASRIAAATARWLLWIAAYDRRTGWASWEAKSCAHWLNWHCGVSPRTAREHVQVAHKLEAFDQLRATFLNGELSYSKVRAISRVIDGANETDLIEIARQTTASQLDRIVAKLPEPDREGPTDVADGGRVAQGVTFSHNGDGTTSMTITAPSADMAVVNQAIQRATSEAISRQRAEGETNTQVIERLSGIQKIKADTATALITGTLHAPRGVEAAVLVVADIDTLTGSDPKAEATVDSRRVDPAVVQRLSCDAIIQTALVDGNGTEQATGSDQRIVPRRLRRLLERRDCLNRGPRSRGDSANLGFGFNPSAVSLTG